MTASTLRQLLGEYRREGFGVKQLRTKKQLVIEITIPVGRALYKQHIDEFMRLGQFYRWNIENGVTTNTTQVNFWKSL